MAVISTPPKHLSYDSGGSQTKIELEPAPDTDGKIFREKLGEL